MSGGLCESILAVLTSCLPAGAETVALHAPCFAGNEWEYVKQCLDSGWVSSKGQFVERFEGMLADYTGITGAVATVNGTAALHISLILAGVRPGDEVLTPALTFVATANAVSYCGAIPHLVDCEARTLGLDPAKLADYLAGLAEVRHAVCFSRRTGRPIRAVIPMHTFGHPVDLDPLAELCARYRITLIEDAAEALGSFYKGKHAGHWGKMAVLSFNGNKTVTTGGGGALLTNDAALARQARHLTTTARVAHQWAFDHDRVGYNYRMPNLNAALGCAQLEQLPGFIKRKRALAERYRRAFAGLAGVRFFAEPEFARSNYWLNALLLETADAGLRDRILEVTNQNGIMTRPVWTLMHQLPMYRDCPQMPLREAEALRDRLVNIPSSVFL
jgi:perosamine synthetase